MRTICICGGGSLGHVIAGYLGAQQGNRVNILTRHPEKWVKELVVTTPEGNKLQAILNNVTSNPEEALHEANIILLCLPGFAIKQVLQQIKPFVNRNTYVGSVFSSTGFFFEAHQILGKDVPLWGFQRVPFIARTEIYGKKAKLLGYKQSHNIAIENSNNKEDFRKELETIFKAPVHLLKNWYEASFTNSNPILHPSRLYSLFKDWTPYKFYDHQFLFYEEWNNTASEYLIQMDNELFEILKLLPVTSDFLKPILTYYESHNAESLTKKIQSIDSFKGIKTPMIETSKGWQPDLNSRYFQEDFMYGLRYIYEEAKRNLIQVPTIEEVYKWGSELCHK